MDLIQERGEREREREGLQRGGKGGMLEEGSGKGQGHALYCFQCACVCASVYLHWYLDVTFLHSKS